MEIPKISKLIIWHFLPLLYSEILLSFWRKLNQWIIIDSVYISISFVWTFAFFNSLSLFFIKSSIPCSHHYFSLFLLSSSVFFSIHVIVFFLSLHSFFLYLCIFLTVFLSPISFLLIFIYSFLFFFPITFLSIPHFPPLQRWKKSKIADGTRFDNFNYIK